MSDAAIIGALGTAIVSLAGFIAFLFKKYMDDMKSNCERQIEDKDKEVQGLKADNAALLARIFKMLDTQERAIRVTGKAIEYAEHENPPAGGRR